ncbi:hypothetical protein CPB83DRAFT_861764 [Crepidotus variabilis]|uniref:HCP-like protein n=1 Tax=Crepidotus variabilis TaxID=179855 RepID=A0A9P6E879_9AGAR|nr:hypothetical protein CPB83DRAFT_861764 [Crepidotus variabilis]
MWAECSNKPTSTMAAPPPPPPPRPFDAQGPPIPPPPPPPLPQDIKALNDRYNTPSQYELDSLPHFDHPMIAPRPHRVDPSIPANMVQSLDDQLYRQQSPPVTNNYTSGYNLPTPGPPPQLPPPQQSMNQNNWTPWGANSQPSTYQAPNAQEVAQSLASLSLTSIPPPPPFLSPPQHPPSAPPTQQSQPPSAPTHHRATSESALSVTPSLTAPLPSLAQLQQAAPIIQSPNHDAALKISWCRDIFFLVDRSQASGTPSTDPVVGPITISDPTLAQLAQIAVPVTLQIANSYTPVPGQKMPFHVAEATSMRANLAASGAFPEYVRHNPRAAFKDYETAARGGFAGAWFRIGRDYENFNDHLHARECFERGVKLNVESCLYRIGMANLLGQLSLPSNPTAALPYLHRAATLASINSPQPAYVYALLLLSEFTQITVAPSFFAPYIPAGSSPHLEARKHLERAAFLHFPAAQYKLGHAYEFAEPPFPFDPLLSVQYYSLASQQGEAEADMALSKWFLCGSGGAAANGTKADPSLGGFEKDEALAVTFAEKAARRGLPSAEFAMGYYAEVGVGQAKNVETARFWYQKAKDHGNEDASERLVALSLPAAQPLSRQEHDHITEAKLVRKRTMAQQRSENQPLSPPWEGHDFPALPNPNAGPQGPPRRNGQAVIDNIRKNSAYMPPAQAPQAARPPPRHDSGYGAVDPRRNVSPSAGGRMTPPGTRPPRNDSLGGPPQPNAGRPGQGGGQSPASRLERLRKGAQDQGSFPSGPSPPSAPTPPVAAAPPPQQQAPAHSSKPGKGQAQTFADLGFQGGKVQEKDCVIM